MFSAHNKFLDQIIHDGESPTEQQQSQVTSYKLLEVISDEKPGGIYL